MKTPKLTFARANELFNYDPLTGVITWKVSRGTAKAGDTAGCPCKAGYLVVRTGGTLYYAHRLAWLLTTGAWPAGLVDHRDGQRAMNVFTNLRDATPRVNAENQRAARKDNTTGLLGVQRCGTRFKTEIRVRGRSRHLGVFASPELAHATYLAAKRQFHTGCTI